MSTPPSDVLTTHAQPEPNRPMPAAANLALKSSKLPYLALMALARLPTGDPPALGLMISQNMAWFQCPPPLLRTAVRIGSGTADRPLASSESRLAPASCGADSRALFRLVT